MRYSHPVHHHRNHKKAVRQSSTIMRDYMDRFMYFAGIVAPAMTVPQIIKIWWEKDAAGVSTLSWLGYAVGSMLWFLYGLIHKEKPIIIANGVAAVLQIMVVIGTLWFS